MNIYGINIVIMKKLTLKERFELWMALYGLTYADFIWLALGIGVLIWLVL